MFIALTPDWSDCGSLSPWEQSPGFCAEHWVPAGQTEQADPLLYMGDRRKFPPEEKKQKGKSLFLLLFSVAFALCCGKKA